MKLKVTKVLTDILNKNCKYNLSLEKMNQNTYGWLVDYEPLNHLNDYNYNNNLFNVIRVSYPPEFYAMDQFITTNDLIKIFKNTDKTLDGLIAAFNEFVEV